MRNGGESTKGARCRITGERLGDAAYFWRLWNLWRAAMVFLQLSSFMIRLRWSLPSLSAFWVRTCAGGRMVRTRSGEAEGATGTQPDDACLCKALEALHHGAAVHLLGAGSLAVLLGRCGSHHVGGCKWEVGDGWGRRA